MQPTEYGWDSTIIMLDQNGKQYNTTIGIAFEKGLLTPGISPVTFNTCAYYTQQPKFVHYQENGREWTAPLPEGRMGYPIDALTFARMKARSS